MGSAAMPTPFFFTLHGGVGSNADPIFAFGSLAFVVRLAACLPELAYAFSDGVMIRCKALSP